MHKQTDEYGDTITVEQSTTGYIDITVNENDEECVVRLITTEAAEFGRSILEAAGEEVVAYDSLPHAGNVSFNEAMLRVAAIHKRTVAFRYQKVDGGYIESRRLNPEAIVGEGDTLGVSGKDPDRDAPRRFRLSQIQGEVSFA